MFCSNALLEFLFETQLFAQSSIVDVSNMNNYKNRMKKKRSLEIIVGVEEWARACMIVIMERNQMNNDNFRVILYCLKKIGFVVDGLWNDELT